MTKDGGGREGGMEIDMMIRKLLHEESGMLASYREKLRNVNEPRLRTFLEEQCAASEKRCRQLEEYLRSLDASNMVTRQINDMFL
jgi:hypothetical protein